MQLTTREGEDKNMTILIIRITFALGVVGHAVNMYCDRILSIFPNGTIKLDNIKEIDIEDHHDTRRENELEIDPESDDPEVSYY